MFTPLNKQEISDIVKIQFNRIKEMLQQNDINIEITESAIEWISSAGFDPVYGARPINDYAEIHPKRTLKADSCRKG
jgi:ATP-dependent Clp protease ATP-binding subunit ClpB